LKFADDTKIFSAVNKDSDRRLLEKDLDNLLMWAEEWQMMFSMSKCKVIWVIKTTVTVITWI